MNDQADMLQCLQEMEEAISSIARSIRQECNELHELRRKLPEGSKDVYLLELKIGRPSPQYVKINIRGPLVIHAGCIEFVRYSTGVRTFLPIADLHQWEVS